MQILRQRKLIRKDQLFSEISFSMFITLQNHNVVFIFGLLGRGMSCCWYRSCRARPGVFWIAFQILFESGTSVHRAFKRPNARNVV